MDRPTIRRGRANLVDRGPRARRGRDRRARSRAARTPALDYPEHRRRFLGRFVFAGADRATALRPAPGTAGDRRVSDLRPAAADRARRRRARARRGPRRCSATSRRSRSSPTTRVGRGRVRRARRRRARGHRRAPTETFRAGRPDASRSTWALDDGDAVGAGTRRSAAVDGPLRVDAHRRAHRAELPVPPARASPRSPAATCDAAQRHGPASATPARRCPASARWRRRRCAPAAASTTASRCPTWCSSRTTTSRASAIARRGRAGPGALAGPGRRGRVRPLEQVAEAIDGGRRPRAARQHDAGAGGRGRGASSAGASAGRGLRRRHARARRATYAEAGVDFISVGAHHPLGAGARHRPRPRHGAEGA